MKIKGAIFDMDGTLVDSLMYWDYLWERVGIKYMNDALFKPDTAVDKKLRTMIYTEAMAYLKQYYDLPTSTDEFIRFAEDGLMNFYRETVKPKAGAIELLGHLSASGIKLCLATATDMRYVKIALDSCKLEHYFDAVISCADIGVGKDKPDIYLKARDLLELPEAELCVFEDSFVALETAKKAGFRTVGVYDRYAFDQDRLKAASDIYLQEGQSLNTLIGII